MEYRKFNDKYILRLDPDEEIMASIRSLCEKENIRNGQIVGIGAAKSATIGLWDLTNKVFKKKDIVKPLEIASLIGNISTLKGENYLHLHITVADENLNTYAGHMASCVISATAEITITEIEGSVERRYDPRTGLNIYSFLPEE